MTDTGGAGTPDRRDHEDRVIAALIAARSAGDRDAAMRAREELILMHAGFVQHVARKHFGHVDEDMIQSGMEGLIEAVDRFDPSYENTLSTYAVHRILAAIRRHRDRDSWSVHAPRHLRQLNARIRNLEREHVGPPLSAEDLARQLEAELHDVLDAKSLDHLRFAASLDAGPAGDDRFDAVIEHDPSIAQIEARETIRALLTCLDEREREVVSQLMLDERIQREVAESFDISQPQVSRIRRGALERMRREFQA